MRDEFLSRYLLPSDRRSGESRLSTSHDTTLAGLEEKMRQEFFSEDKKLTVLKGGVQSG
jgi:hypothetical protein